MWVKNKRVILMLLFYSIAFVALFYTMPREMNWNPSFSNKHDWPFGNLILFDELQSIFPDQSMTVVDQPLYNLTKDTSFQNTNYIVIDQNYSPDSLERMALMNFVSQGNNAFIAMRGMHYRLLDTLNIQMESDYNLDLYRVTNLNALSIPLGFYKNEDVDSTLEALVTRNQYYFDIKNDSIEILNPLKLSWSENESKPVFIRVPFGEGYFYLHSMPFVFTNFHMVNDNTHPYISECLSYLPNQSILWDEYHKKINALYKQSIMHVVLNHGTLKWAYWIGFFTLILFMVFHAKRRQRIIPVIEPLKNESLEFTETIGALYYNQGNHTDIANKKIKMFREYLNRKFFLNDIEFNEEDKKILLSKTVHTETEIAQLFKVIRNTLDSPSVTEARLKLLNKKINEFYKK